MQPDLKLGAASQARLVSPDPAGLAAADPNNPQSWNRYAYVGGNPLAFVDPFGMQPCNNASLERENKDHQVGGPYSPDEDGEADNSGDCSGGWQTCYLDGVDVGCSLLGDFTGGPGGIGGLPESVQSAVNCAWSDCMGAGDIFDKNNNVRTYNYVPPSEGCTGSGSRFNCYVSASIKGLNGPIVAPGAMPCGIELACHAFVGFGNFFINGQLSGGLELLGSLSVGVVGGVGTATWDVVGPALGGAAAGTYAGGAAAASWIENVAVPTVAEIGQELIYNPEVLVALGECGAEFIPNGPPPATPLGLVCHGAAWGLDQIFGGH